MFKSTKYADADVNPAPVVILWSNETYPNAWLNGYMAEDEYIEQVSMEDFHELLSHLMEIDVIIGVEWNLRGHRNVA